MRHTTAHGLTIDWSVSRTNHGHVLHGFIGYSPVFSCQLRPDWTHESVEQLVVDRLRDLARWARENKSA